MGNESEFRPKSGANYEQRLLCEILNYIGGINIETFNANIADIQDPSYDNTHDYFYQRFGYPNLIILHTEMYKNIRMYLGWGTEITKAPGPNGNMATQIVAKAFAVDLNGYPGGVVMADLEGSMEIEDGAQGYPGVLECIMCLKSRLDDFDKFGEE